MIVETICRGLRAPAVDRAAAASLIECPHDDGEPFGQAPDLVGPARRDRRAREPRVDARGGHDLDARVRRRAARVTDQPQSQPPAEEPATGTRRLRSCPTTRRPGELAEPPAAVAPAPSAAPEPPDAARAAGRRSPRGSRRPAASGVRRRPPPVDRPAVRRRRVRRARWPRRRVPADRPEVARRRRVRRRPRPGPDPEAPCPLRPATARQPRGGRHRGLRADVGSSSARRSSSPRSR